MDTCDFPTPRAAATAGGRPPWQGSMAGRLRLAVGPDDTPARRPTRGWAGMLGAGALAARLAAQEAPDAFHRAETLSGTEAASTASNVGATREPGEPEHAGNPGGASLWWSWTAPAAGWTEVTTGGSDFDTLLGIYTGEQVEALDLVAANDDAIGKSSAARFPARAGITYRIAVDGFNNGTGPVTGPVRLALSLAPGPLNAPPGDDSGAAIPLGTLPVTVEGDSADASREPGEPRHAGRIGSHSLWHRWIADRTGPVLVSTAGSAFDTLLAVYTRPAGGPWTAVAANDDVPGEEGNYTSRLEFPASAGVAYWIAVDGYDGARGQVVLSLRDASPVVAALSLEGPEPQPDGSLRLWLRGPAGRACQVETSGDLATWSPAGTVTLGADRVPWGEIPPEASGARFYRGRLVP